MDFDADPAYAEMLAREFSLVDAGDIMKWDPIHPARSHYDFGRGDQLVEFAEANGRQ